MSLEDNLEDCIWGKFDWSVYTEELVGTSKIDEEGLLGKVDIVKGNISRQIRKAVEQHYPRLVEQASALQNLDRVQSAISREIGRLNGTCEKLSERFQFQYDKLRSSTSKVEQLYALRRILSSAARCEQLVLKLETTNDLVKRSEIISELEAISAEMASLKDVNSTREMVSVKIPRLATEVRQNIINQLKSSLESLNASLISSSVRALNNLSSYDMVVLLEQYSLLSTEIVTRFCEELAKVVSKRIPENAPYATRFVQLLSKVLSVYPAKAVQPLEQSFQPLKRAILSQSLNRMFKAVDCAFEENNSVNASVEKIESAIKEELCGVEWDVQLKADTESNVAKVLQLVAQKIEQRLILDPTALQMGERISSIQVRNYGAICIAHLLSLSWPAYGESLTRIVKEAKEAVLNVAHSSVFAICLSMHNEKLNEPSPYVKELCNYLRVFQMHASYFLKFAGSEEVISSFMDYVIELFLLNSSLLRPVSPIQRSYLSSDLQYIVHHGLSLFTIKSPLINLMPQFIESYNLPTEKLAELETLPFWFIVHLLISSSEETLLSPHTSAGWTLEEYLKWFLEHSPSDQLNFLSNLMRSYTSSVIARGQTEYVSSYPLIMNVLQRVVIKG